MVAVNVEAIGRQDAISKAMTAITTPATSVDVTSLEVAIKGEMADLLRAFATPDSRADAKGAAEVPVVDVGDLAVRFDAAGKEVE